MKQKTKKVILERRFVPKGTVIIEEGEEGYCAYLIQSGAVQVYKKNDGQIQELARLEAGEICGEMAIIDDETTKRSANVRTTSDCNLIIITRAAFKEKLENSDPTVKAVVEMLAERLNSITSALTDGHKSDEIIEDNDQENSDEVHKVDGEEE